MISGGPQMPGCEKCGRTLLNEWYFCPNCGKRTELVAENNDEPLWSKPKVTKPSFDPAGAYGKAVRDQVFEVIVRQALAGAPWRQICAGPIEVNNIDPDDIQAEVDRRRKTLKKGASVFDLLFKTNAEDKTDDESADENRLRRSGASGKPKKPSDPPSGEASESPEDSPSPEEDGHSQTGTWT